MALLLFSRSYLNLRRVMFRWAGAEVRRTFFSASLLHLDLGVSDPIVSLKVY